MRALPVRHRIRALRVAVVIGLVLCATSARGSNFSLFLEPGYLYDLSHLKDATGREVRIERQAVLQNYRLGMDLDLSRTLTLSGSGAFVDTSNWVITNGQFLGYDQPSVVANGRLTYATQVLQSGLQYDYSQQWGTLLGISRALESATAYLTWMPVELPQVEFRLNRSHNYDVLLTRTDLVSWNALANARYVIQALELRYYFNWFQTEDKVQQLATSSIDNSAAVTYTSSFFGNRLSVYANGTGQARSFSTVAGGAGATVARQQFPIQGLSVVEAFPATPQDVVLAPNPALIDGNVLNPAGINIGYGPSLSGDRALRDVGVGFADASTPVNMLYLWVDKPLPADVAASLAGGFTAWASSDNARWTQIPLAAPVVFASFNNRFEIAIPQTSSRFLKVVTGPLLPGVSSDRLYAEIFVTELQTFQVVPASSLPPQATTYNVIGNATVNAAILRGPNLDYDFSIYLARQSQTSLVSYTIVNGLSLNARLDRTWSVSSRVARQDLDPGSGHEVQWQWNASVVARPLPTLYGAFTYGGQLNELIDRRNLVEVRGTTVQQSLTLFGRADLYQGVSLQATVSGTNGLDLDQRASTGGTANLSLLLIPNPWMSLNTNYAYTVSWFSGGFLDDDSARSSRLNATFIVTPFPALSGSASLSWLIMGDRPALYGTFQVNYSPWRGDLQLAFAYNRTFDTASRSITQLVSPAVRWTIRPGVFLNLAYTLIDTLGPVLETSSQTASATLIISL
jgi:hypothetical protein